MAQVTETVKKDLSDLVEVEEFSAQLSWDGPDMRAAELHSAKRAYEEALRQYKEMNQH